jgi:magnesium-transporting ATPase (P-type)
MFLRLRHAVVMQVRPVMVTGDNAQCGHYIAKQCMMIAPDVRVLLGDIDTDGRYCLQLSCLLSKKFVFETSSCVFGKVTRGETDPDKTCRFLNS